MSADLPRRPSIDFLKKLAKERLQRLRAAHAEETLARAQLDVAREYGFASWRALKQEVERRRAAHAAAFASACANGAATDVSELLAAHRSLARERLAGGTTGLHLAARHPQTIRLLLEAGADPRARDTADRATPLHLAAAAGQIESVALLLDAGAPADDTFDVHESGPIGWAAEAGHPAVVERLVAAGARHHLFSAMALRDYALVERLIEQDPAALMRRRSRYEGGQTPVHAAFAPPDGRGHLSGAPDYPMLTLLLELGADPDAPDDRGRTPMQVATRRADAEAIRRLQAAGAGMPADHDAAAAGDLSDVAASMSRSEAMFRVSDVAATVRWYQSIGFTVTDSFADGGEMTFARLRLGAGAFALSAGGGTGPRDVSLWFFTDRVQEVYDRLVALARRRGSSDGDLPGAVPFEEDLYTPFYGGRQFSVRDVNGLVLVFWQMG